MAISSYKYQDSECEDKKEEDQENETPTVVKTLEDEQLQMRGSELELSIFNDC